MQIRKRYFVLIIALSILVGGVGTYAGLNFYAKATDLVGGSGSASTDRKLLLELADQQESLEENMGKMTKVVNAFSIIQEHYVEDVGDQQLIEGAIQGMLGSLEDPYSTYMDQETMEQFNEQIESSFEGIGAEVSMMEGNVTIVAPIKDSPAEKAGLRPNDQVITVDGESVEGLNLQEAVNKIRGEKGSQVTLEIQRPGVEGLIDVEITRDSIPLETVYADTREVNGETVGIIELTSFSETTADDFEKELQNLESQNIAGLVIDVRGNPGGLLPAIENILKNFIPKDIPYMQMEDPSGKKTRYFSDLETGKDYPVATIINGGSASASEILAASLKEAIGAEVVGETSFGKGTVQQTVPMGDGSTIKITRLRWLTPEGNSIHEVGVEPTVEQKMPDYYYTHPIQVEEPYTFNQSDEQIENFQIMLEGLDYDPGRKDGYFNKETEEAIENFQTDQGLPVTGELDKETAEVLQTKIIEQMRENKDDLQLEKAIEVITQTP